jgi:hypothetical protein
MFAWRAAITALLLLDLRRDDRKAEAVSDGSDSVKRTAVLNRSANTDDGWMLVLVSA